MSARLCQSYVAMAVVSTLWDHIDVSVIKVSDLIMEEPIVEVNILTKSIVRLKLKVKPSQVF